MASKSDSSWPKVGSEAVAWARDENEASSRRQSLKHRGPYQAAIVPRIAETNVSVSSQTLSLAEDAALELARFDAEVGLMVAPFAAMLLRSEAASSSQIENLTASAGAILKAEFGLGETPNSALIVSNQLAMEAAIAVSQDFNLAALLGMHKILMETTDPVNAGNLREQPVWIGGTSLGPHGADYVGPQWQKIPELMSDLVSFCLRTDLPAIVQAAIAHAQIETIHPFTDGNGRTGRALVQTLLHRLGVTNSVAVPVSAGLLKDTSKYFKALESYRLGELEPIITVFANAAHEAVWNGRRLAAEIQQARMKWQTLLNARSDSGAAQLLEHLLEQPLITSTRVVEILGITPANALNAIDRLVAAGILSQLGSGKRNRIWQATDVVVALERFAERSRRS
jgi:Fic family protein